MRTLLHFRPTPPNKSSGNKDIRPPRNLPPQSRNRCRETIAYMYKFRVSLLFRIASGVKVPIASSVYGYTKVLAHNLSSKKTSGAAIAWLKMDAELLLFFLLNLVFEHVRSERDIIACPPVFFFCNSKIFEFLTVIFKKSSSADGCWV